MSMVLDWKIGFGRKQNNLNFKVFTKIKVPIKIVSEKNLLLDSFLKTFSDLNIFPTK